ncbi:MarR family transcriptional regulator [Paenibacillus sp. P3E]|uniref:winged helix DNA-binding protein n=1 Tax=Paenibacillus sp. P3E TaxID=1349435 RepID=UPI00093FE8A2|nr:winged helix DNA-binding protein [Paenibacillus sp. P3E]OKP74629.1 MarR family transcriptional regulator [Paenibacillus sp. P3E]
MPYSPERASITSKQLLIHNLMESASKLQKHFQTEDDDERRWMIRNCNNPLVIEFLQESTVMMLHVIDAIGKLEPVNGASISKEFGIPKGSVSKVTRRLLEKGIISTEFLPDNKKEVLFRTTALGREVFELHQALHRQMNIGIQLFLERYTEEELSFIIRGLEDTMEATWTEPETIAAKFAGQHSAAAEEPLFTGESPELQQITAMLRQLDERSLKKAKTILQDVFFTSY